MDFVFLSDFHYFWVSQLVERDNDVLRIHVANLFLFLDVLYHTDIVYCPQVFLSLVFEIVLVESEVIIINHFFLYFDE